MTKSILTKTQKLFLKLFANTPLLSQQFYLTGGTALTTHYIPYRYSEDLDFFSEKDIDTKAIATFLKSIKKQLKYQTFDLNTSYNRNIFFLNLNGSILKTEFTYFPFPPIESPKVREGIKVDSILDIAVNKLFTIYQKPRGRDFTDLYMIQKKYHLPLNDLIAKAKIKFDWHIDPLKLGTQLLLSAETKDYPRLLKPLKEKNWQNHFKQEAKKLGQKIITK